MRLVYRWRAWHLPGPAARWLSIFTVSLGLFFLRFLVPSPVGQADNRDGPRLMCGLGVGPLTSGHDRFYRFAYFTYVSKPGCASRSPYPSSELVPLIATKLLTPVLGLPGSLNLILLGLLMCVLASVGIASLATGLRVRRCAQLVVAAAVWLIIADSSFFDVFASPFSEPAALVGLLLTAAGLLYLGRGWAATRWGLILAGAGGFLAILSKEQYLIMAAPICVAIVAACADWTGARGLRRFRTQQATAGLAVSGLLLLLAAGYTYWNYTSHYGQRLEHIQAVDMIFTDIVTTPANAPAGLRALGLPPSWAKYAGHYYWYHGSSVRNDPLLARYYGKLTDTNIAHYLLTRPASLVSIGQKAAVQAQSLRVTSLGDYPPSAGHRPGTVESRVIVATWLAQQLPRLGLWLYVPLWLAMAALAVAALARRRRDAAGLARRRRDTAGQRGPPWYREAAVLVLCMTGCAVTAFVPPAFFAGISTTRHMVGTNLATALALTVSVTLAVSMTWQVLAATRRHHQPAATPPTHEMIRPGVTVTTSRLDSGPA